VWFKDTSDLAGRAAYAGISLPIEPGLPQIGTFQTLSGIAPVGPINTNFIRLWHNIKRCPVDRKEAIRDSSIRASRPGS
jgi:hypothetical protein